MVRDEIVQISVHNPDIRSSSVAIQKTNAKLLPQVLQIIYCVIATWLCIGESDVRKWIIEYWGTVVYARGHLYRGPVILILVLHLALISAGTFALYWYPLASVCMHHTGYRAAYWGGGGGAGACVYWMRPHSREDQWVAIHNQSFVTHLARSPQWAVRQTYAILMPATSIRAWCSYDH